METNWMPKVAGILDIIAGSFGIFISCFMLLWFVIFSFIMRSDPGEFQDFPGSFIAIIMIPFTIFIAVAGILAIVGGIHALRKKKWGLALAGSIGALFGSSALGVAAIIFTTLSKQEFE